MNNSSPVNPVNASAPPSAAAQAVAGNAVANSNAAPPAADSSTVIHSMNDLREKAPAVYKAMVKGMVMTMMNQCKNSNDHLIETIHKAEADNNR